MPRLDQLNDFDFGDGVPNLPPFRGGGRRVPVPRAQPRINAGVAIMGLVLAGQLVVLVAVLAGGNALIGAAAGLALLACGLIMVGVRAARGLVDRR